MSTFLNLATRPTVQFDVANRTHRRYYAMFLKNRSWRECPVQFHLERGYSDVSAMIENKLTAYFLGREMREPLPTLGEQWADG